MTVFLKITALAVSFLAHGVSSVDIAFVDGADCTDIGLYGTKDIPYLSCYDLSSFEPPSSVHSRNMTDDRVLHFFSDLSCQVALHSTENTDDQCYRSSIAPYNMCLQLAGTVLVHTAGKRVARRFQMTEGTVINLRKRAGLHDGLNADSLHPIMNTTVEGDDVVHIGSAERIKSRRISSLEQDLPADHSFLLDVSTGMHSSPFYQLNFGDGGLWHFSSFYEHERGDFVNHMRPASETEIEKRFAPNPYNTIRWKSGGFDFVFCEYNSKSPASDFNNRNKQQVYDIAYDQITCLHSASYYRGAQGLGIDLRNEQGSIIGEVAIQPYTGSSGPRPPSCNPNSYPTDGDRSIS